MLKEIYAVKGWTTATAQCLTNAIKVKMRVDSKKRFVYHHCGRRGTIHSKRTIYIIDSPCIHKNVIIEPEVPQILCPHCGRSRLLMFAPARWIAQQYSISYSAVLRIDREILRTTQPEPCLDGIEGILVDEQYLGASPGFVTLVLHARTGEPPTHGSGQGRRVFGVLL